MDEAPPAPPSSAASDREALERLFALSLDMLCVIGADGRFQRVSPAFDALGYTREELSSRSLLDLVHPDDRDATRAALAALDQGRATIELEGRCLTKDGRARRLSWRAARGARGTLCVAARDVTDLKDAERALQKLAAIVEHSEDAILTEDLARNVTSWNRGATELFGFTAEEMLDAPLARILPPDSPHDDGMLERLRLGQSIERFETTRHHKDGRPIEVSVTVSPLLDAEGAVVGASKILHDVSTLRRSERAARRAKEAAETASKELEAFSYSVAHDLRSPLRAIDGFSQALLEEHGERLDDEGRRYLRFVRESAQRMARLIDDLLGLSRVTRLDLTHDAIDLTALAEGVVETIRREDPARDVDVAIEAGMEARGDRRLLFVAMDNLLRNAWKFTSKRPRAHIEVATERDGAGGAPVYVVRDDGVGFDMAYASKLFGTFQRLHSIADYPGTGIGLATVQRIVRRHGGRIWAEAEVDRGATFRFTLNGGEEPRA